MYKKIALASAFIGLVSLSFAQAPTTSYAVGVRTYNWSRGTRQITTYIYYPATGTPGGSPIANAPVAAGVFPVCEYTHGYGASPQAALNGVIQPLASSGFIVAGPYFPNASPGDVSTGNLPKDVSQVLTNTLALNGAGTPFTGHINTSVGVGVSGHSMGGMTTDALLTSWPDSRVKAAIPISCIDEGTPSSSVTANVMFVHGDKDPTCPYSSARQAYSEEPPTKAFLTFIGGDHNSFTNDPVMSRTIVDWMRWSLYSDSAAHSRLATDAAASDTKWEIVEKPGATVTIQAESASLGGGAVLESTNTGYTGSGYVNFSTNGGTCTFNSVNGGTGGTRQLIIRYANGSGASRTGSLIVNGANRGITFPTTTNWTTWTTMTVSITVNSGTSNTITFQSTGQDLANIDQITVQ